MYVFVCLSVVNRLLGKEQQGVAASRVAIIITEHAFVYLEQVVVVYSEHEFQSGTDWDGINTHTIFRPCYDLINLINEFI